MILDSVTLNVSVFAVGLVAALNGSLWTSTRAQILAKGRQGPAWAQRGIPRLTRLVGLAVLATWAWNSTRAVKPALLLGFTLCLGLFCLIEGPLRIMTRMSFLRRGPEAPAWSKAAVIWQYRLVGVAILLGGLIAGTMSYSSGE